MPKQNTCRSSASERRLCELVSVHRAYKIDRAWLSDWTSRIPKHQPVSQSEIPNIKNSCGFKPPTGVGFLQETGSLANSCDVASKKTKLLTASLGKKKNNPKNTHTHAHTSASIESQYHHRTLVERRSRTFIMFNYTVALGWDLQANVCQGFSNRTPPVQPRCSYSWTSSWK